MRLSGLIEQADAVYGLALGETERHELHRRLTCAGFGPTVDRKVTTRVLDAVFQTADSIRNEPQIATATTNLYSGMKQVTAEPNDQCPRCHQGMNRVELVGERQADYCQACCIALPVKA
jgi:hypothetical protein